MPDLEQIRDSLPAHYADCKTVVFDDRFDCDCTATADVEALLDLVAQQDHQLDQAARTVLSIVDPDGTYKPGDEGT